MDALSNTVFRSSFPETRPLIHSPNTVYNNKCVSLKFPTSDGVRVLALKRDESSAAEDKDEEERPPLMNGFGFDSFSTQDSSVSLSEGSLDNEGNLQNQIPSKSSHMERPLSVPYGSVAAGGTRAGLFRTPISGGVQNATSAHGLPPPALAVRNLIEQVRFAHLCTVTSRMHHHREGYPFGSLVDFAPDPLGHPIFSFSPLAIHTRNLLANPRCTLNVQIPGWSSLSTARVTIFGDVYPLPESDQEWAHKLYISKHQQSPSEQWGNFRYFRMMNIRDEENNYSVAIWFDESKYFKCLEFLKESETSDIYFIGGFGTVAWIDIKEYEALQPDKIAVDGGEQYLKELNAIFCKPLKELLSRESEVVDDAAFISIDSRGTDIRVRQGAQFNVQRISFDEGHAIETLEEAKAALWKLINKARAPKFVQVE